MAVAKDRLIQAALDLAWSHWTGLGVRGTAQPPDTAVDPEALAYLTATLAAHDARLRDEALDWWVRFQRHVSRPRLASLARTFDPHTVAAFEAFDARRATNPRTSGKSQLERLDLPARSLLRFRCVFGANARAEVLLALLAQWGDSGEGVTTSALAEVGYSKRNIALVLDDLRLAGVVLASAETNRVRYRLANPEALRRVLDPPPAGSGRWHVRLPIIAAFVAATERWRDKDPVVQAVEARKLLATYAPSVAMLRLEAPRASSAERYWVELKDWLVDTVMPGPSDPSRRWPRMIEGAWVAAGQDLRRPERFSSAVLPALSNDPAVDSELTCLDLVQVAAVQSPGNWTWDVLSTAATNTFEHTIALSNGEPRHFATWDRDGGVTRYRAEYVRPLSHNRIARIYGDLAAAHARRDLPAVQVKLRRMEPAALRERRHAATG